MVRPPLSDLTLTGSAIEVHLCGFDVIDRSVAGILSSRVTRSES